MLDVNAVMSFVIDAIGYCISIFFLAYIVPVYMSATMYAFAFTLVGGLVSGVIVDVVSYCIFLGVVPSMFEYIFCIFFSGVRLLRMVVSNSFAYSTLA